MGTSNSTPVHPEMENIFWEEIATNGTKPVTDLPTNIYCKSAVLVGENTYLFGNSYTYDNTTYKVTYSPPQIHVFNITSRTWRKIEATPPAKKFGADYYGTKIGTDIWVINDGTWYCFDTTKEEWRTDSISTPCGHIRAKSVAVNGDKIYIYNSDHQNIKHNIICLDTKEKKSTELPDAFGEHPEERQETYLYMIDDNTLGMFAPETSSDSYRGEFFYYDLTENKWARAKDPITKLGKDKNEFYGDNMTYVGRVDNILYFLGFRDGSKRRVDAVWCREICSEKWIKVKIGGETYFNHDMRNAVAVTDSTLYYFTNDSRVFSMKKSFMNEHVNDSSKMLSELARKELSAIKAPVVEIPEFNNDPIVLDAQLAAVKEKLDIHYRITEDVSELKLDELSFLEKTVPEPSPTILHHKNFLHYLTLAWSNHFSVVISPDIIFYTILCEIADQIKKNPEDYRTLFTDSMEKKQIITLTSDPEKLDLNAVIAGIAKNTPVDAEIFTASFSCSSLESRLAMNAAFCDAMSPYYDYANTCCGIPRIKVLGTKQDWQLLEQKVHRMRTEVFSHDLTTDKTLSKYLNGVEQQIRLIHTSRDPSFWKNMFSINRCGSGHTDQVKGWICLFYREFYSRRGKSGVQYLGKDFYNYESHISIVKWTNIDTDRKFKLETGLLYSNVVQSEDPLDKSYPWLEPQFAHYTQEDKSISMEEIKEMVKQLEEQAEKK